MNRPSVDIVVPFVGSDAALHEVAEMLERVNVIATDTVTIADNRPSADPAGRRIGSITVSCAAGQPSSYFARNRGAERGQNPWLVFLDADVVAPPELIDTYFATPPPAQAGILIGGIEDAPSPGSRDRVLERHQQVRGAVGHKTTLRDDEFSTAQTANVAIRRSVFEQLGGFTEGIRSGGDADFCLRAYRAGFTLEPRFDAGVLHHSRSTLKGFIRQYARYGSGSQWLEARFPGFSPRPRPWRLARTLAAQFARACAAPVRSSIRDTPLFLLDSVRDLAFYVGRYASNDVAPPAIEPKSSAAPANLGDEIPRRP